MACLDPITTTALNTTSTPTHHHCTVPRWRGCPESHRFSATVRMVTSARSEEMRTTRRPNHSTPPTEGSTHPLHCPKSPNHKSHAHNTGSRPGRSNEHISEDFGQGESTP